MILSYLKTNAQLLAGALALTVLCSGLSYCQGRSDGAALVKAEQAKKQKRADELRHTADITATTTRAEDVARIEAAKEEQIDTITKTIDERPADATVAANCGKLRRLGRTESSLPDACRN